MTEIDDTVSGRSDGGSAAMNLQTNDLALLAAPV